MSTVTMCVAPSSTSVLKGTRSPSGRETMRTKTPSHTLGRSVCIGYRVG